ncbi:MAG: hypothetical protein RLZ45_2878, partial [Verrucomicrobiota bacterium]
MSDRDGCEVIQRPLRMQYQPLAAGISRCGRVRGAKILSRILLQRWECPNCSAAFPRLLRNRLNPVSKLCASAAPACVLVSRSVKCRPDAVTRPTAASSSGLLVIASRPRSGCAHATK